jgi:hypothetical protein
MPKNSEGEVRLPKGQAAPIDIDALLYEALRDPSVLTPELSATIERVLERSMQQHPEEGLQPQRGAARRKVHRSSSMT